MMRVFPVLGILVVGAAWQAAAQKNYSPPDLNIFLSPMNVGSNDSGLAVPFYGCDQNGATLQQISLWANDQFIRGISAKLTDGKEVWFGCLNVNGNATGQTGCSNLRNSNFTFQSGERITNMMLYPGPNVQGQSNKRAGAVNFNTSLGRTFDFGTTGTRPTGVSINVGQGIPCGIAPKAGADIDSMAFIFLRNVTTSALQNMQYSGVSASSNGVSSDTAPLQESADQLVLSNQTFNNSGKTSSLVSSFASQAILQTSSQWSYVLGLDAYLMSPVNGSRPQVPNYITPILKWRLAAGGVHARNESIQTPENWNNTVTVGPHGASQLIATSIEGAITTTYTALLNVTLDSGYILSFPISGLYTGVSSSPVNVSVVELAAADVESGQTLSSSKSGTSNTVAWVVGILIGLICGLLLAALLAWAIVILTRRQQRKKEEAGPNNAPRDNPPRTCLPSLQIPALFGKTSKSGVTHQDVEMAGKNKWIVEDDLGKDVSGNGFKDQETASSSKPQKGERPESEGQHVLPYNIFRRLRLNSVRQSLGLENENTTPLGETQKRWEKEEDRGDLSSPSESSTPRTIPEMSGHNNEFAQPSEAGAESIEAQSEAESSVFLGGPLKTDDKVAFIPASFEDEKEAVGGDETRKQRMREQVSQRLAQRHPTPERSPAGNFRPFKPKANLMGKISSQIASYRSSNPTNTGSSGVFSQGESPSSRAIKHDDASLKLGAGYTPPGNSKQLEKNSVFHDNDRIRLGTKYQTQGRNE